ncbi:MAG: redoxin domain-containing protein [Candidatus Lambdaproteobacteria bacterium]|nr:redoxin domain-containing protein [Candidatus Lambdaproteobacteria bacterium]
MPMLEVGALAPPFELPNQDGLMVRLEDLRGKRVVFWFYPRADTPG